MVPCYYHNATILSTVISSAVLFLVPTGYDWKHNRFAPGSVTCTMHVFKLLPPPASAQPVLVLPSIAAWYLLPEDACACQLCRQV